MAHILVFSYFQVSPFHEYYLWVSHNVESILPQEYVHHFRCLPLSCIRPFTSHFTHLVIASTTQTTLLRNMEVTADKDGNDCYFPSFTHVSLPLLPPPVSPLLVLSLTAHCAAKLQLLLAIGGAAPAQQQRPDPHGNTLQNGVQLGGGGGQTLSFYKRIPKQELPMVVHHSSPFLCAYMAVCPLHPCSCVPASTPRHCRDGWFFCQPFRHSQ